MITLRPATLADAEFLFRLRTDPETVAQSFGPAPQSVEAQRYWMEIHTGLYIAEMEDISIGTGRLGPIGAGGIGLTIAPEWRGRGLAVHVLRALEAEARQQGRSFLLARVKPQNIKSWRAFLSAGYQIQTPELMLRKLLK